MHTIQVCPGCRSERLKLFPVSRRSGRVDFQCRDCRLSGWAERETSMPEPVSAEVIDIDEVANWTASKRADTTDRAWADMLDELDVRLGGSAGRHLYDIGAGDGAFLALARERGYEVSGNEILAAAADLAAETHGVTLDLGDITRLGFDQRFDAVTMWCVLAHVPHGDELLDACFRMLRPGGVLFLQTPHRSAVDGAALRALDVSGGRVNRWIDRRIATHHWLLHTPASIEATLRRSGFTDVHAKPVARYSLQTSRYLRSLGVPDRVGRVLSKSLDVFVDRDLAPRIVLDVFATRPDH